MGAEKQQRKINVGDGGGWYERITVTVQLRPRCFMFKLFRSRLSRPCQYQVLRGNKSCITTICLCKKVCTKSIL